MVTPIRSVDQISSKLELVSVDVRRWDLGLLYADDRAASCRGRGRPLGVGVASLHWITKYGMRDKVRLIMRCEACEEIRDLMGYYGVECNIQGVFCCRGQEVLEINLVVPKGRQQICSMKCLDFAFKNLDSDPVLHHVCPNLTLIDIEKLAGIACKGRIANQ